MHAPPTMLVDYGDLPSLALLALHLETPRLILFQVAGDSPAHAGRQRAIERHVDLVSGAMSLIGPSPVSIESGQPVTPGLQEMHVILQASFAALQIGCSRVISPRVVGRDHQAVAVAFERAVGLQQLIERDGCHRAPLFELPLIDFADAQILELAVDHRVPLTEFWPCDESGSTPCDRCGSCQRWQTAFQQVGVQWPWPRPAHDSGQTAMLVEAAVPTVAGTCAQTG